MRLIDADKLIEHLSDYALMESPIYPEDTDDKYQAIRTCIKYIEKMPTLKPQIVKEDDRLKVKLTKVYEESDTK